MDWHRNCFDNHEADIDASWFFYHCLYDSLFCLIKKSYMFDLVLSAASFCINLLPIIYFRLKFFLSKCMFLSFFLSCSFISFVYLLLFFFLSYLFRFWSHTDSHCHNFSIFVVTDMKSYYLHSTFRTSYISLT